MTLVWLPPGVRHAFANGGDEEVRAVGVTSPAGIEAMLEDQCNFLAGPIQPLSCARLGADRTGAE